MPRMVIEWVTGGPDETYADAIANYAMQLLDVHDPSVSSDLTVDPYADE